MQSLPEVNALKSFLERSFKHRLSDYVTAIAWSPLGNLLAAASGAGEVQLVTPSKAGFKAKILCPAADQSVDVLAFSGDGKWLAMAGQAGQVSLWEVEAKTVRHADTLECGSAWIDRLQWHPTRHWLAFNQGKQVQIWDADCAESVTLLTSPAHVQALGWSPDGRHFAVSAQQFIYIWNTQQWEQPLYQWELPSASRLLSWSPEGAYLASINQDSSVGVLTWAKAQHLQQLSESLASGDLALDPANLPDWMRGFPGKIRQMAWAKRADGTESPMFAIATRELLALWQLSPESGWQNWILDIHNNNVLDVAFQPSTDLLASASADGWVILWKSATEVAQILDGAKNGFSCIAWHPTGEHLAAGGQQGEVIIWTAYREESS